MPMHACLGKVYFAQKFYLLPYKRNIWRTLYLANEGKNRSRIGKMLNWRSTLQQSISAYIANGNL